MKERNAKKIEYLFDEIGGISDVLINEAAVYREAHKKRHFGTLKVLAVAACLVLCFALTAHTLVSLLDGWQVEKDDQTNVFEEEVMLDRLLTDYPDRISYTTLSSVGELDLFGDAAYIVWQEEGSDLLCVSRELTGSELENLRARISQGRPANESTERPACRVWIVCGDGSVISPYLKPTDGNVSVGSLFDYEPELVPSSSFTSYVSDILEEP